MKPDVKAALDYVSGEIKAYNKLSFGPPMLSEEDEKHLATLRAELARLTAIEEAATPSGRPIVKPDGDTGDFGVWWYTPSGMGWRLATFYSPCAALSDPKDGGTR